MILRLKGRVIYKDLNSAILDVSGVGYKVFASNDTLSKIKDGSVIDIWTYLVVRENLMDLYGFIQKEERDFFEHLIGISGIGPKSALAILSLSSVETLRKAISSEDSSYLTKVSGIGRKSAQKIILELKDKMGIGSKEDSVGLKEETETLEALRALGYSLGDARDALKKVGQDTVGTNERIKEALKILGGNGR